MGRLTWNSLVETLEPYFPLPQLPQGKDLQQAIKWSDSMQRLHDRIGKMITLLQSLGQPQRVEHYDVDIRTHGAYTGQTRVLLHFSQRQQSVLDQIAQLVDAHKLMAYPTATLELSGALFRVLNAGCGQTLGVLPESEDDPEATQYNFDGPSQNSAAMYGGAGADDASDASRIKLNGQEEKGCCVIL